MYPNNRASVPPRELPRKGRPLISRRRANSVAEGLGSAPTCAYGPQRRFAALPQLSAVGGRPDLPRHRKRALMTHSCDVTQQSRRAFSPLELSSCSCRHNSLDYDDQVPEAVHTQHWQQRLRQKQPCRTTRRVDSRTNFRSRFDPLERRWFGSQARRRCS